MSANIPESTPHTTTHPPAKRQKTTPTSLQSSQITALFARPDHDPLPSTSLTPSNKLLHTPSIVNNVQGSSAGAGSGEFHVYKASRRREYERLRAMDEEVEGERIREEFEREREERERADEERTRKLREKRAKKGKGRKGGKEGKGGGEGKGENGEKTKLKARVAGVAGTMSRGDGGDVDGENEKNGGRAVVEEPVGLVIHDDD